MANRKITQFANLGGAQSPTMIMPVVDPSLGSVAAANLKSTLNDLFADIGINTSDGATSWTGLLAAPAVAAATKLKTYYHRGTVQWLFSRNAGAYFSVTPSIAAGLTAGWLPYADTGGVLNGSSNATLDASGSLYARFLTIQSSAGGLNSVAEINDSTGTDRWEIRLGASNQLVFQDFQNNKNVLTLTPAATPTITAIGNFVFGTTNTYDIGAASTTQPRSGYFGTGLQVGRASNQTGTMTFLNSANAFTTVFQAGAAAASRTYTWPLNFGVAGSVLTDAAGDGTLSWATAGLSNPYLQDSGSSAAIYFQYSQNTPSVGRWGVERGSGGATIFTGASLNAVVFGSTTASLVEFFYNDTKQFTIPTALGSSGQFLSTNGAGVTSWATPSGLISGLTSGQVAYATGATTIGGSANLTWNNATGVLALNGTLGVIQITNSTYSVTAEIGAYGSGLGFGTPAIPGQLLIEKTANAQALYFNNAARAIFRGDGIISYGGTDLLVRGDNNGTAGNGVRVQGWNGSGWQNAINVLNKASGNIDITMTGNGGLVTVGSATSLTGQFNVLASSSTTIGQIIKLAASQSADAFQIQDSTGTNLTNFSPKGVLIFGASSATADRAIWLRNPNYDTSTTLYGVYYSPAIPATATGNWYGNYTAPSTAAAAFTLGNLYHNFAVTPIIGAGSSITTATAFYIQKQKVTGVGTGYGVYQADSADINRFDGKVGIGANPTYQLDVQSTSNTVAIRAASNTAGDVLYYGTGTVAGSITAFIANISASGTVTLAVQNSQNTSSAEAAIQAIVGGASASDPYFNFTISGVQAWSVGVDNSDSDKFKIGPGSTPSSGIPSISIKTTGEICISGTDATTVDLGIARNAAGVLEVNNGTAGTYRDLLARYGRFGGVTASGVVSSGGVSTGGAYYSISTSSQVANDSMIIGVFGGSAITGLLYGDNFSASATTGFANKYVNTENATATSNCFAQYVVGGASGGDPYIAFQVSGATDWSIGIDNSAGDVLKIGNIANPSAGGELLTISTGAVFTFTDGAKISAGATNGLKVGNGTSEKLGFWGVTAVVQQVLATGAAHTVDDVITFLQTVGLCKQS